MSSEQSKNLQTDSKHSNSSEQNEEEILNSEVVSSDFEKDNDDHDLLNNLSIAVKNQNVSVVHELLKEKPNLQTTKAGHILWDAIFEDNMEIASMLIRSGANLNVKKPNDTFESSLLYELGSSKQSKHQELALLVIEFGGKAKEFEMEYILCRAIESGSLKIVEALLRKGTPVKYSIMHQMVRSPQVIELIGLFIGADYIALDRKYMRAVNTFYQLYILSGEESRIIPAVETLLNLGLDINVVNAYGDVLICAIRCRKIQTIQLLIKHRINVNKRSKNGILPLYLAASTGEPEIVELFIKSGARINDRCDSYLRPQALHNGQTALHAACRGQSKPKILNILLSHGADVNVVDLFGRTPFSYARSAGLLTDAHRVIIKHFATLVSKGIAIHEIDMKIIEKNSKMKKFYDECMRELKPMESISASHDAT